MILTAFLLALPFSLGEQQTTAAPKETSPPPAFTPSMTGEKTTILIQAKARADDLTQAFDTFKKEKPTYRISARLANGDTLANILELTAMPNGTLFIAKVSTSLGSKIQLVSVDDIVDFYFP